MVGKKRKKGGDASEGNEFYTEASNDALAESFDAKDAAEDRAAPQKPRAWGKDDVPPHRGNGKKKR